MVRLFKVLTKILSHYSPSENPWCVPAIILLMYNDDGDDDYDDYDGGGGDDDDNLFSIPEIYQGGYRTCQ
jgi:hypothetical protein